MSTDPTNATHAEVPRRALGRTGEQVSMVGLGGYHLGLVRGERAAARIVHAAVARGIDFLDNSWDYHEGASEERMGAALKEGGYRDRVFLMTKVDGRTKKAAARQLHQSLRRLRTDRVDLLQLHEVIRFEDADRAFAAGGAIEALVEARAAGKARYLGFTGHKDPSVHLYMLEVARAHGFAFDAVQLPLNVMDAHFRSFEGRVLPALAAAGAAALGMKSMAAGKILESGVVTPVECLHYAMNLPTAVVITGIDRLALVEQAAQAAASFRPLSADAVARLLAKTAAAARGGRYEPFKTTAAHDATAEHTEWLG